MDYEKKYNEALAWMRGVYPTLTGAVKEDAEHYFPELAESEDERIRQYLIEWVSISDNPRKKECLSWLEKQKEASKAIEAVERIDKYIDGHLANAHDMKDSNPDKKYYRGWDDALGKMAGILQDVYSGEKQKAEKPVDWDDELEKCKKSPLYFYDKYVKIKLKPAEWSEEDERMLSRCEKSIESSKQFADSDTFKKAKDNEIDWLENRFKSLRPSWKPSKEDLMMLEHIIEQYEIGNKNSKVRGYLPKVEELNFLKKVFEIWKN